MKFEKLILYNFMRYKGRNEIVFSCEKEKNVTVILGDNASGKTTIAQAFRFGLYGEIQLENGKKKEDYQLLNHDVIASMNADSRKTVFVEIEIWNEDRRYRLHREEVYIRKFPTFLVEQVYQKKSLYLSEDNGEFYEIEKKEMESIIQELFPKDLSAYFLFDGEKWNHTQPNGTKETIKDSVHKMTGLSPAEMALYHIKDMGKNSARSKIKAKISGSGAIYDNIQRDIERGLFHMEDMKSKMEIAKRNAEYYENEIQELENYLLANQSTESLQKEYKTLENLCESKQKNIQSNYKNMILAFSDMGYQYFAVPMIRQALKLTRSVDLERKEIPYMKQATIDYLIKKGECICGRKIENPSQAYEHLLKQREFLPPASIGVLLSDFEKMGKQWSDRANEGYERIKELACEITKEQEEYEKYENEYIELGKKMDGTYDFGEKRSEIKRLQKERDKYVREEGVWKANMDSLKVDIERKEEELQTLAIKTKENERWKERMDVTEELYNRIQKFYKKREIEVYQELNQKIQVNFDKMFNTKDKKIVLDKEYGIKLMYQTEHGLTEEKNLSEGEKIARNFAFITTIMEYNAEKIRARKLGEDMEEVEMDTHPIVLDGPFSKLGAENISLIASSLPKIADQVIIFMLEKDWKHTKLDDYVGSEYYIKKSIKGRSAVILKKCQIYSECLSEME